MKKIASIFVVLIYIFSCSESPYVNLNAKREKYILNNQKQINLNIIVPIGSEIPLRKGLIDNIDIYVFFKAKKGIKLLLKFNNINGEKLNTKIKSDNEIILRENVVEIVSENTIIKGFKIDELPVISIEPILQIEESLRKNTNPVDLDFTLKISEICPTINPTLPEFYPNLPTEKLKLLEKAMEGRVIIPNTNPPPLPNGDNIVINSFNENPTLVYKRSENDFFEIASMDLNFTHPFSDLKKYIKTFENLRATNEFYIFTKENKVFENSKIWLDTADESLLAEIESPTEIPVKIWNLKQIYFTTENDTEFLDEILRELLDITDSTISIPNSTLIRHDVIVTNYLFSEFKFGLRLNAEIINFTTSTFQHLGDYHNHPLLNNYLYSSMNSLFSIFTPSVACRDSFINSLKNITLEDRNYNLYDENFVNVYYVDSVGGPSGFSCNSGCDGHDPNFKLIMIQNRRPSILAHEFGHLFGLCHVNNSTSIMFSQEVSRDKTEFHYTNLPTFTIGQAFKANFSPYSYLNRLRGGISKCYPICGSDEFLQNINSNQFPCINFDIGVTCGSTLTLPTDCPPCSTTPSPL